jgi:4a-hydroxytetrahydrobiopterin dehydratase
MTDENGPAGRRLTRQQMSDAVTGLGWRYLQGGIRAAVRVPSLAHATAVLGHVVDAAGESADGHLLADVRADRVLFTVQAPGEGELSARDLDLAATIAATIRQLGLTIGPAVGEHAVQSIEIAIDAIDIAAVRPFWMAVLGYADESGAGPAAAIDDPRQQGPAVWFQQMDAPRPQRNRIHVDVLVAHDEAPQRIQAALAAGGRLVSDAEAPAFWVLADVEGNEACVCTWQGRD